MLEKITLKEKVTLKELRKLTGMTQNEFAKEVGIPLTSYRRYEADVRNIDIDKLWKICDSVGIGIEMIKM